MFQDQNILTAMGFFMSLLYQHNFKEIDVALLDKDTSSSQTKL